MRNEIKSIIASGNKATWSAVKGDVLTFERLVLSLLIENGEHLKSKRFDWAGRIWRSDCVANKIFTGTLNGKRHERMKTDLTGISQGTRILKTPKTVSGREE